MSDDHESIVGKPPIPSDLPRIYSPAEVLELFSTAVRPTIRVLIEKARATGRFSKMGRRIVFTRQNIEELIDALSCRPKQSRHPHRHHTRATSAHERVLARLERAAKDSKEAAKKNGRHGGTA